MHIYRQIADHVRQQEYHDSLKLGCSMTEAMINSYDAYHGVMMMAHYKG